MSQKTHVILRAAQLRRDLRSLEKDLHFASLERVNVYEAVKNLDRAIELMQAKHD